ncbi:YaiI/YqxD family protein [Paenibacillus oleatilyticus]|uniref:YaiI/YqxD family protein n=1 Tax=Paenibacillus oleatilyticus TaxID=2594886 RepID=UPI001C1F917D|nr:YaiI/YqxD family protein [Paenibacillus oleatilyticus]MBU7320140.1 YaiI/YqxD family protein [Paenibacillus oleatilyticus]
MTYKIVVDADACPVKAEIAQTALRFGIPVLMVASFDHRLQPMDGVDIVQVDRSDQSVDLYIVNYIAPGDVLVTQDFGLAALALGKKAMALSNRGQTYNERTIDFLLERRHEQAKQRRGGKHTKGPKAFTDEDRQAFLQTLTKVLSGLQENRAK